MSSPLSTITLDDVLDQCWQLLEDGAARARAPFHTFALATADRDGPHVRTVVLRRAERETRCVLFHTDRRSPKAEAIVAQPTVALLFYDPDQKVQLRARAEVTLHTEGPLLEQQWRVSRPLAQRCYMGDAPPGTEADSAWNGLSDEVMAAAVEEGAFDAGRDAFAVGECELSALDWLQLSLAGHRRARFRWTDGAWSGRWITP